MIDSSTRYTKPADKKIPKRLPKCLCHICNNYETNLLYFYISNCYELIFHHRNHMVIRMSTKSIIYIIKWFILGFAITGFGRDTTVILWTLVLTTRTTQTATAICVVYRRPLISYLMGDNYGRLQLQPH